MLKLVNAVVILISDNYELMAASIQSRNKATGHWLQSQSQASTRLRMSNFRLHQKNAESQKDFNDGLFHDYFTCSA